MKIGSSLAALAIAATACGSPQTPAAKAIADAAPRTREVASPKVCVAKQRLLDELGRKALGEQPPAARALEPEIDRGAPPPIEAAYQVGSPATVLIRTREGMGSGVIIDAGGLVLTNHHVVDEFLQPDLTIKVTLEFGKLGETGRMVRQEKTYQGIVLKTDAIKDLALVKIVDPPKNLPVAKLSELDPHVGEEVISIGNAGIGLMWAAKVCNVSKVGDMTRETSMLEAGDCSLRDPTDDEIEAKRRTEQCEARKKEIRKEIEQSLQGLSVQTTCAINGGDSGGPLLNAWGELVGLNQSIRSAFFSGTALAFHVHIAEIREFLRERPTEAAQVIPDVYCEGGLEFKLEDFDGDGVTEAAAAAGFPNFDSGTVKPQGSYLFDLDEDDGRVKPSLAKPFDAEVALLLKKEDAYAFYDRNGDGVFDLMLRDKGADGKPEFAYKLEGNKAISDAKLLPPKLLDVSLIEKPAGLRLGASMVGLALTKLTSPELLAVSDVPAIPNALKAFGKKGNAQDTDDDKKPEIVFGGDIGSHGFLVDVTSKDLQNLKSGDEAAPLLEQGKLKPQFVFLDRPSGRWALYDFNEDGNTDLALFGQSPADNEEDGRFGMGLPPIATHAFVITKGAPPTKVTEHLGRSLIRPELFTSEKVKKALQFGPWSRSNRGGFPNPIEGLSGPSDPWKLEPLDQPRQILEQTGKGGYAALIDLDRDSKKLASRTPDELAQPGEFDAEIAIVRMFDVGWVFYDTDKDGAFDVIVFSRAFSSGNADNVVRLDATGDKATVIGSSGPLFRPELLKLNGKTKDKVAAIFEKARTGSAAEAAPAPPAPPKPAAPKPAAPKP